MANSYTLLLALGLIILRDCENDTLLNIIKCNNSTLKLKRFKAKHKRTILIDLRLIEMVKIYYFRQIWDSSVRLSTRAMNMASTSIQSIIPPNIQTAQINLINNSHATQDIPRASIQYSNETSYVMRDDHGGQIEIDKYEVMYILGHGSVIENGKHITKYLVQWKNFSAKKHWTEEPKENFYPDGIDIFQNYLRFVKKYGNPLTSNELQKKVKDFFKMPTISRNSKISPISSNFKVINGPNSELVYQYINHLINEGYYSTITGVKSDKPWKIGNNELQLYKWNIEIIIWRYLYNNWIKLNSPNYKILKRPIGNNCEGKMLSFEQNSLIRKTIDFYPDIKTFKFLPTKSIGPTLIKDYLKEGVYDKPVICLIICQNGNYGSYFHALIAIISKKYSDISDKKFNGYHIQYIDSWPDSNAITRVTSILSNGFPELLRSRTTSEVTFGEQQQLDCFHQALTNIGLLLDGKSLSDFNWIKIENNTNLNF